MEDSDYGYGIDILIACEAVAAGLPFCAVDLGVKVHRARRWSTIDAIAVEVAESALRAYRRSPTRRGPSVRQPLRQPALASSVTPPHGAIADTGVLTERWRSEREQFAPMYARVLRPDVFETVQSETAVGIANEPWHQVIRQFALACRTDVYRPQELSAALMPLFLGRMAVFADEIAGTDPLELTERLNRDLDRCLAAA